MKFLLQQLYTSTGVDERANKANLNMSVICIKCYTISISLLITLIQHNYQVFSLGKCAMILPTETDRRESITVYATVVYLTQTSSW